MSLSMADNTSHENKITPRTEYYNALHPNGLVLKAGGEPNGTGIMSEATKQKMSKSHIGKKDSVSLCLWLTPCTPPPHNNITFKSKYQRQKG